MDELLDEFSCENDKYTINTIEASDKWIDGIYFGILNIIFRVRFNVINALHGYLLQMDWSLLLLLASSLLR